MTAKPSGDVELVLQANRRFYAALMSMDLEAMDRLWLNDDWVRCVHPDWGPLEGWEAVRESWQQIFENTQQLHVAIGNTAVHIEGEMAWISCIERVTSTSQGRMETAYVQATNLFVRRAGAWQMVLHHASHLPSDPVAESEETVH